MSLTKLSFSLQEVDSWPITLVHLSFLLSSGPKYTAPSGTFYFWDSLHTHMKGTACYSKFSRFQGTTHSYILPCILSWCMPAWSSSKYSIHAGSYSGVYPRRVLQLFSAWSVSGSSGCLRAKDGLLFSLPHPALTLPGWLLTVCSSSGRKVLHLQEDSGRKLKTVSNHCNLCCVLSIVTVLCEVPRQGGYKRHISEWLWVRIASNNAIICNGD